MAVDVTPGTTFVAGTPRPLFSLTGYRSARNRQQYDVAPGDRRFLMIREPDDAGPGTVVYVENWFAELQAKVRAAAKRGRARLDPPGTHLHLGAGKLEPLMD